MEGCNLFLRGIWATHAEDYFLALEHPIEVYKEEKHFEHAIALFENFDITWLVKFSILHVTWIVGKFEQLNS